MPKFLKFLANAGLIIAGCIVGFTAMNAVFYFLGKYHIVEEYLLSEVSLSVIIGIIVGMSKVMEHDDHKRPYDEK